VSEFSETDEIAALQERLQAAKRAQLSDQPVRDTFRARHAALLASRRARDAVAADQAWRARCQAYDRALTDPPAVPAGAEVVQTHGLTLAVPGGDAERGFAARLRSGWLPWRDIIAQRELGVGTIAVDVGANIGTTSMLRVIAGDVQRVYALEPEPLNFACLVYNVAVNGLQGVVLPDALAVSSGNGRALLRQAKSPGAHRLMIGRKAHEGRADTVWVESIRLDDWIDARGVEVDAISVVKVDTQGWESHVLTGAPKLLACRHIAWIIEVSPKHLAAAGTPLPDLLAQIAASFTHAIDLRPDRSRRRIVAAAELPDALAYLDGDGPNTYTNLALYHAS
jgi:FkbM family methyltransferase